MDLSIDEKMQLVRKMREEADYASNTQPFYGQSLTRRSDLWRSSTDEKNESRSTLGLRVLLAGCMFGYFLFLHYEHATVADLDAEDIIQIISEDSLSFQLTGER